MIEITSFSNKKCRYVKSLAKKKARCESREYTVEGIKSVSDALSSDKHISGIYMSKSFYDSGQLLCPDDTELYVAEDSVFQSMCDTKTPQGVLAVIRMEEPAPFTPDKSLPYVYCDGINDPGNLGTIIRSADAAGFGGVLMSRGCADLYSPKTVRASMGSFFNTNVITDVDVQELRSFKALGFSLIGGALSAGSRDYRSTDYKRPVIIIVGNEANGISKDVLEMCEHVKIPILGSAESLNAAVAASILMYEAVRQRT